MPVTSERYSDVIATQMTKLFRPPFACTVEQWIQTTRGMRCFSWSARSVLDEAKSVVAIVAIGRDITNIRHELKAIRKKDDDLMLVIESGSPMYYSHNPEHTIMFVSPRIRALLGCKPHAGHWVWMNYLTDNPANAAALERTLRAVTTGKREPPYRLEMAGANGNTIWFEVNEIPVVKNGKVTALVGSMVDITERMHVDDGAAEVEVLMKVSETRRNEAAASGKAGFGFLKGIFGKNGDFD